MPADDPAGERQEDMIAYTWPEAGRIYCEKEDTWCWNVDTDSGCCTKQSLCPVHDPECIAQQERAEKRMQDAYKKKMAKRKNKKEEPQKIRRQTKTKLELIDEAIERKKEIITYYYEKGKPKKALRVDLEVARLKKERELYDSSQSI